MIMALCIHELELANCEFCRIPAGAVPKAEVVKTPGTEDWGQLAEAISRDDDGRGPWFEAKYASTCAGCGNRIEPGEQIRADDDLGDFVCRACGSQPA
jgi:hypothetical protein